MGGERLMLALIGTLVDDLRGGNPQLKREARQYMDRQGGSEPFGFARICLHFGWTEPLVRRQLNKIDSHGHAHRWRSYSG
jgi:hypothetical protein